MTTLMRAMRTWLAMALVAVAAIGAAPTPAAAQSEVVEYYATDAVGSIRVVFDAGGNVAARSDYLPFGEALQPTGALPPQRFTGQERDGEAGLDNFNLRALSLRVGRFNRIDPAGGMPANPQTWNRYAYVLNNPLVLTDPTGALAEAGGGLFEDRRCSAEFSFGACGGSDRFWDHGGGGPGFGDGYGWATRYGYFDGMPDMMWEGLLDMHVRAETAFLEAQEQNYHNMEPPFEGTANVEVTETPSGVGLPAGENRYVVVPVYHAYGSVYTTLKSPEFDFGLGPAVAARVGETAATALGRYMHKLLAEKVVAKGWRSNRGLVGGNGRLYRPDIMTPSRRLIEYKPNTPSGRAAGARQKEIYERELRMPCRVVYYGSCVP